jgi:uncharacterized protein
MNADPLTEEELEFLNDLLLRCENDDAILDVSEMDGFLTAIASGPEPVMPNVWLAEFWGGPDQHFDWASEDELRRFTDLVFQHMNNIAMMLMQAPEEFEPLFNMRELDGQTHTIVEEWCFGYMRGVALGGGWAYLPPEKMEDLQTIALHGMEENFDLLDAMTREELIASQERVAPAVRELHAYWLSERVPPSKEPIKTEFKTGRNEPCLCGSGKKYKKCCLH